MATTIFYLSLVFVGFLISIPLGKHESKFSWIGSAQNLVILLLVLTMGAMIGSNHDVVANLDKYGFYALVFTFFISLFSLIVTYIVRSLLGIDAYGQVGNKDTGDMVIEEEGQEEKKSSPIDSFTVLIALCVLAGIFLGYWFVALKPEIAEGFLEFLSKAISIELSTLLLFVGIDLGFQREILDSIKSVGLRVFFIPLAIVIGTIVGAAISGKILNIDIKESLAIGAGMGWYSLSSAILMDAGMITAASIAFLHNVMRELAGLLLVPLVARTIGYVESVAIPGCPSMDVCLPVVAKATRGRAVVYSFVSGFVLSLLVPVLVPLFI
ncbi:MAG: lysine exporter LysO family protein [Tissierellia bacterium]|nr:lysine exporter LysO family protein [Tissierellia bacterium]